MAKTRLFTNGNDQAMNIPAELAYDNLEIEGARRVPFMLGGIGQSGSTTSAVDSLPTRKPGSRETAVTTSTSIRIDQTLYDQARSEARAEHRTIAGQIEHWAKVGRAALDNPDLPASFIAESLASMAEPREDATAFTPRSRV